MGNRMLDAAGENMRKFRLLSLACSFDCKLCSLSGRLAVKCADFNGLASQFLTEFFRIDLVAVLADDIHHVERNDHRDADFHELGRKIKVALDIGSVDDVQDYIRLFLHQIVSGYHFLQRIRAEGINARKVLNDYILVSNQTSFLLLNGNTRPVSDILCTAGQVVEQSCFAAVRIACKSNFDFFHGFLFSVLDNL